MSPEFWRLIDQTRPGEPDPTAHAVALTRSLVGRGVEEIVGFAEAFDRAMDDLYTWELWGAAYFAFGGCGDDAFEYLRAWIVGQGETIWALAKSHPESAFLGLLDDATDPDARWEEIKVWEGESLLYAAGNAHEELTGDWLSSRYAPHPAEPVGIAWDEALLPQLYPGLAAALPEDSCSASEPSAGSMTVALDVERGIAGFGQGDHAEAAELLEPLIDDPVSWLLVPADRMPDVAYAVGIGRLLKGDVEGSARALRMAGDSFATQPHLRRALAQVEMANGELDLAASRIDHSADADPWDRVLAAKLAWRQGRVEEALTRASAELDLPPNPEDHPWDIAGRIQQVGQIFVEAGDAERANQALEELDPYVAGAPVELPLLTHVDLLKVSVVRMQRPEEAVGVLEAMTDLCEGTDRAECLRELARCRSALGDEYGAAASYRASVDGFNEAGERWEAAFTAGEAGI